MKSFRERNAFTTGIVGTALIAAVGAAILNYENLPLIGTGTSFQAEFSEAAGLQPSNEVRVAGIKVGEVTDVELAEDRVLVTFRVSDTWVGDRSTAEIKIKTLLGQKFLNLYPSGNDVQDPDVAIPLDRTTTPYDVTTAFEGLASTAAALDTDQLAESFRTLSDAFRDSPQHVRTALDGLSSLSRTIASRDNQLADLLSNAHTITKTLAGSNDEFETLINDGNLLLTELDNRRDAIHRLLTGTRSLADQVSGLVADNQAQLSPTLEQLGHVTDILQRQNDNIDRSIKLAAPYFRVVNNTIGNGHWIDNYLCGLVPENRDPCVPPRISSGGGR
ncbi:ABC transporter substrate-binding protein [Prauserella marina]|uniref:Phospholipid/cholesterol/gamma-HCH transport system substrate-binding protein n=1 Tax=Prauserella marina TaxID=530584 RepID=A0A222VLU3_9PSEU|nr:MCE family protein [Prauserella marina]ASR34691.1 ABC transporter substrate-binding protein [Prauserella marina]PWV85650.1 phospholipid/cholesterol/gamma-HCH transport system substrate-binding protein [Prauserella marina]SDC49389.1 phospholipid/cholesterol/gamma-HCH transport system substrate-binding protein [Prauserella marina]